MRIYVPLLTADVEALRHAAAGAGRLLLPSGRPTWAVTPASRADRAGEDLEDLEYDALQDAVYAGLEHVEDAARRSAPGTRRIGVAAGDVSDAAVAEASDTGGAFGVVMVRDEELRIASLHVTERGATAVREDDTDPALLWFDVGELPTALDYLAEPAA